MNTDRRARSRQPVQRLDRRQQQPATDRRPVGDIITYQDSAGRDLETDEDENDYDDSWPPRIRPSARRYDIQTEEYPRAGNQLVVPPRQNAVQHLPPGVVLIRGIPCANVGGAWMKVALHDTPPPEAAPPKQQPQHRQT